MFFDILDFLKTENEITSEEVGLYKAQLKNIGSLKDLMMIAA